MKKLPTPWCVLIVLCVLLVIPMLCMGGCAVEQEDKMTEKRFQMIDSDQIDIDDPEVYKIYVDIETGVLYVRMCSGYQGGFSVMVDPDGKPLTIQDWNKR